MLGRSPQPILVSEVRDEGGPNVSQAAKGLQAHMTISAVLEEGIAAGMATREPKSGWVLLKGPSAISDALPPEVYTTPGFAQCNNKAIRQFRRHAALSAFLARISVADLEAQLHVRAKLITALNHTNSPISAQSSVSNGENCQNSMESTK